MEKLCYIIGRWSGVTQDFVCCRVIRRVVAGLFVGLVGWLAARQHGNCEDDRTRSKGERPCKAGRRRPRAKPLSFALPLLLSQLRQPLFLFRLTGSFASLHFSLVRFLSRSHFRSTYPLPILRLHVRRGYVTSNLPSCTAYIENCRLTYRERGYQRAHPAFRSTLRPG